MPDKPIQPLLMIAGCGASARAVVESVHESFRIVIVDLDQEVLDQLESESESVTKICGDVTSTLVLKGIPLDDADYVVAMTGDDEVNEEFCCLASQYFEVKNIICVAMSKASNEKLEKLGVTMVSRPGSVASVVESTLDKGRRRAVGIGLGQGEIMEVEVQPNSPVIGKTLAILRPQSWLLGAIYRNGELVVPHGHTEIKVGDRCLLVGEPSIMKPIAEYFQRGFSEFPLQFGTRLCVYMEKDNFTHEESKYLIENTALRGARMLVTKSRLMKRAHELSREIYNTARPIDISEDYQWPKDYTQIQDICDAGLVLFPKPEKNFFQARGYQRHPISKVLAHVNEPLVLSRDTHPYKKILLAINNAGNSRQLAELAVDMARKFKAKLTAVACVHMTHVSGEEHESELKEALDNCSQVANTYSLNIETRMVTGNPVREFAELSKDFDLLIVGHRSDRPFSWTFHPDVSQALWLNAACSTMVLAYKDPGNRGKS